MKNNYIKLFALLVLSSALGACKKELNVFPTTREVDGNVITDQNSAMVVLNGVYYRFADAGFDRNNVPSIKWTDLNEDFASELSGGLINSGGDDKVYTFEFTASNNTYLADGIWNYGYGIVNAANGFIKNVVPAAGVPGAAKTEMLAEAKFLRAYANSELLLYYGQYNDPSSNYGIILRNEFLTADNINLPRSTVAATYTSILGDLDAAIAGLPAQNTAIYYANVSDAKLLKARVLMNRGASGDYAQVITLTNDIITNSPFKLDDSLKNIFLTEGFSSPEVMLAVQPYPNQTYKFLNNQYYNQYIVSDSLVSLLKTDGRSQWMYKSVNSPYNGPINELTKYYSGDPLNVVQTPLSENCYAFRLSEAYLLEAEAIALSGGSLSTAKTLLEAVMTRAGAGAQELAAVAAANTPAALQLLIVEEDLRNFAFENGVDWFALRRLPFPLVQKLNPNIKLASQMILPIPYSEISHNPVIQNPGY
jgi:hypothetical protein